ncbi:SOS response-associated peptidase [Candidatus Woesearchaeota archaeon]|nr:SOS response-associated peptidase [Candidatus Woesearchaeota archaeon]
MEIFLIITNFKIKLIFLFYMCGRFGITFEPADVKERFHIDVNQDFFRPSYNISPSQSTPVILNKNKEKLVMARFGLIPKWAKDANVGYRMVNARSETINKKQTFKPLFKKKRCLILADYFYEWKNKIPYVFRMDDKSIFCFAGIYDEWEDSSGEIVISYSILTTTPNFLVKKIHDRMPVIIDKSQERNWLDKYDEKMLLSMLKPFNSEKMYSYQVSDKVNKTKNDFPELIKPANTLNRFFKLK